MSSIVFPCGTETSSAAPSKAPSGMAIRSASAEAARAALPPQPDTRRLQIVTSGMIASGCGRVIGPLDERQAGDDLRRIVALERAPPGAAAPGRRHQAEIAFRRADIRD